LAVTSRNLVVYHFARFALQVLHLIIHQPFCQNVKQSLLDLMLVQGAVTEFTGPNVVVFDAAADVEVYD